MTNLEPETIMRNFLRNNLTDYNSSNRNGGQWVYDDWPNEDLSEQSFPRVSVQKITENGSVIGTSDNDTWDTINLQIDVLVHKKTGVLSVTHTDEAIGTIANSARINFDYLAGSVTNIKHDTTSFGTVTAVVNDSDFTSPASLATDTVQWSKSTGNLNFSTQDLSDHSGESITSTYVEKLEGAVLAKRIGRDIVKAVKNNWRTDEFIQGFHNPEKISGPRVLEFGIPEQWHRVMVEYKFNRFNTGEEV